MYRKLFLRVRTSFNVLPHAAADCVIWDFRINHAHACQHKPARRGARLRGIKTAIPVPVRSLAVEERLIDFAQLLDAPGEVGVAIRAFGFGEALLCAFECCAQNRFVDQVTVERGDDRHAGRSRAGRRRTEFVVDLGFGAPVQRAQGHAADRVETEHLIDRLAGFGPCEGRCATSFPSVIAGSDICKIEGQPDDIRSGQAESGAFQNVERGFPLGRKLFGLGLETDLTGSGIDRPRHLQPFRQADSFGGLSCERVTGTGVRRPLQGSGVKFLHQRGCDTVEVIVPVLREAVSGVWAGRGDDHEFAVCVTRDVLQFGDRDQPRHTDRTAVEQHVEDEPAVFALEGAKANVKLDRPGLFRPGSGLDLQGKAGACALVVDQLVDAIVIGKRCEGGKAATGSKYKPACDHRFTDCPDLGRGHPELVSRILAGRVVFGQGRVGHGRVFLLLRRSLRCFGTVAALALTRSSTSPARRLFMTYNLWR